MIFDIWHQCGRSIAKYLDLSDVYRLCSSSEKFHDCAPPIDLDLQDALHCDELYKYFEIAAEAKDDLLQALAIYPGPPFRSIVLRTYRSHACTVSFYLALTKLICAHRNTLELVSVIYIRPCDSGALDADDDELHQLSETEAHDVFKLAGHTYPYLQRLDWAIPGRVKLGAWFLNSNFPRLRSVLLTCNDWITCRASRKDGQNIGSCCCGGHCRLDAPIKPGNLLDIDDKKVIFETFDDLFRLEADSCFFHEYDSSITAVIILNLASMVELISIGCRLIAEETEGGSLLPFDFFLSRIRRNWARRHVYLQSLTFPCREFTPQEAQLLRHWKFIGDPESMISVNIGQEPHTGSFCLTEGTLPRIIRNMLAQFVEGPRRCPVSESKKAGTELLESLQEAVTKALSACGVYDQHGYLLPPAGGDFSVKRFGLEAWSEEMTGLPFTLDPPVSPEFSGGMIGHNAFTCKNCGNNRLFCHIQQQSMIHYTQAKVTGNGLGQRIMSLRHAITTAATRQATGTSTTTTDYK